MVHRHQAIAAGVLGFVCLSGQLVVEAAQPAPVQVVIYNSNQALYQAFFDAFTKQTGILVEPVWYTGSQVSKWEQTITKVTGGLSPDIVTATSTEFVQYAAKGLIEPLDGYLATDAASLGNVIPIFLSALQWQGKQYQMPYGASGLPLAYNAEMFEQAGVAPPPAAWGDPGWTWETFAADSRKLTLRDANGKVSQWGYAGYNDWLSLPYDWGGDYIDASLQRFTGAEPGVLNAWRDIHDLAWVFESMPKPDDASTGFYAGGSAMSAVGTWGIESMLTNKLPLYYAPWFRVGDQPPVGVIYPVGFAMLSSAPHKQAAWELIKFATLDPEGNYLWSVAAGALPGESEARRRWVNALQARKDIHLAAFNQMAAEHAAIINVRKATEFNQIGDVMGAAWDKVMTNAESPSQVLQGVASQVQALIAKGTQ